VGKDKKMDDKGLKLGIHVVAFLCAQIISWGVVQLDSFFSLNFFLSLSISLWHEPLT
jgi:hypothetical protein